MSITISQVIHAAACITDMDELRCRAVRVVGDVLDEAPDDYSDEEKVGASIQALEDGEYTANHPEWDQEAVELAYRILEELEREIGAKNWIF